MRAREPLVLVVASGPQGPTRRLRLAGWQVVTACVVAAALLAAVLHGALQLRHLAPRARGLQAARADTARLQAELTASEVQLRPLRAQKRRIDQAAGRVWAYSGLRGAAEALADAASVAEEAEGPPPAPSSAALAEAGSRLEALLGQILESYHDRRQLLASTPSVRPAKAPWPSSSFGPRLDPITGAWVLHKGLDLAGERGTPIIAPADGRVIWVGWRGGYGRTVVLDHGYGLQTHFAHLDDYRVQPGDRVRRGDLIAIMGSSGRSTGPHLHYEVRRGGQPLDPRRFILD